MDRRRFGLAALRLRLCFAFLSPLAGCADAADTHPVTAAVKVVDSAGVRIVTSERPQWELMPWSIDTADAVTIGLEEGPAPYLLEKVVGAVALSDGRIVIADGQSAELRFFSAAGEHLLTTGGRGGGPGEFRTLSHLTKTRGDTLIAWESGLGPRSFFAPSGTFLTRISIDHDAVTRGLTRRFATEVITPLSDGSFVVHATVRGGTPLPETGVYRTPLGFYRFHGDTYVMDSLGWYNGGTTRLTTTVRGRRLTTTALSPARAQVAASWDARRVIIGDGDRWNLDVYRDGRRDLIMRLSGDPAPFPDSIFEEGRRMRITTTMPPQRRDDERLIFDAVPRQTHLPAFYELVVDSLGNLWAQGSRGTEVFDTTGQWLGTVRGVRGQLLSVGAEYILSLERDSMMVERVVRYRLRRDRQ